MKNYSGGYQGAGSKIDEPLGTVTAKDHNSLVTAHILTLRRNMDGQSADEPLTTISCSGAHHAEVQAFLVKYFSTGAPKPVDEPLDTITTKDRFAVVMIHGEEYMFRFPLVFGSSINNGEIDIFNSGDTYADMVVELAAASSVTAPYILNNTNGKRIKVSNTLNGGNVLTISTVRRAKNATIGGTRCLIDPTSQFSDFLEKGLNRLAYGSDNGSMEER